VILRGRQQPAAAAVRQAQDRPRDGPASLLGPSDEFRGALHEATPAGDTHRSRALLRQPAAGARHEAGAGPGRARGTYLAVLTWVFTLFSTLRVFSYLPTLWAIVDTADSSQHSLWTWGTWLGANLTMAAWLFEQEGQRFSRAVVVNIGNAAMCAATITVIVAVRF
jgi:hypothetical protein